MVTPTPPRRFRFGLRTLFVVIVAIPCAWVGYSLNWIRQRHAMIREREVWHYPTALLEFQRVELPKPPGGLWLFSEQGGYILWVSERNFARAKRLFPEAHLRSGTREMTSKEMDDMENGIHEQLRRVGFKPTKQPAMLAPTH